MGKYDPIIITYLLYVLPAMKFVFHITEKKMVFSKMNVLFKALCILFLPMLIVKKGVAKYLAKFIEVRTQPEWEEVLPQEKEFQK